MEALFIKIKLLIPGFIGAFLAAITGPDRSKVDRFVGFVFGFCIAMYGSAPLLDFFNLSQETYGAGIGFSLGYFGMSLTDSVMRGLREIDIAGILKNRWGK